MAETRASPTPTTGSISRSRRRWRAASAGHSCACGRRVDAARLRPALVGQGVRAAPGDPAHPRPLQRRRPEVGQGASGKPGGKQAPAVASGADLGQAFQESPGGNKSSSAASGDPALRVRPGSGESFRDGDAAWAPEMVVVPAGSFMMGTAQAEIDALCKEYPAVAERSRREGPQHKVTIAKPFAVGRFAVTRGEFGSLRQGERTCRSRGRLI